MKFTSHYAIDPYDEVAKGWLFLCGKRGDLTTGDSCYTRIENIGRYKDKPLYDMCPICVELLPLAIL